MKAYTLKGTLLGKDIKPRYLIRQGGRWLAVTPWIFRSWAGKRRISNRAGVIAYRGPVYNLGSATRAKEQGQ
jgi:hypothetical protein